jgi:hypothetical protein
MLCARSRGIFFGVAYLGPATSRVGGPRDGAHAELILTRITAGVVLIPVLLWLDAGTSSAVAFDGAAADGMAVRAVPSSALLSIRGRIAVLSAHAQSEAAALHEAMWTRFDMRAVRWLQRKTGLPLDAHPAVIPVAGLTALALGGWLLVPRIRRRRLGLSSLLGALIVGVGLETGVAAYHLDELRRYERLDVPGALQSYVDILAGRGLNFDVITDWKGFVTYWASELTAGRLPYAVLAWAGVPAPATEIDDWVRRHRDLPILHVGLGAALPGILRDAVSGVEGRWGSRILYASRYDTQQRLMELDERLLAEMSLLPSPFAFARLEGAAVLRLDDPGASQNAYLQSWLYPSMTVPQWREVEDILKHHDAQMSIGLVVGWVDDGDPDRGDLWIRGQRLQERLPGRVYPSRWVRYHHKATGWVYDLEAQARFFQSGPGGLDFEVHGHTHLTPDVRSWLEAPDRYRNADWYREFLVTHARPPRQRSVSDQLAILDAGLAGYRDLFDFPPSTLIPPGMEQSHNTAELARSRDFRLLSSRQLTILRRHGSFTSRLVRLSDFGSDKGALPGPFPLVLVLHDRDIVERSPTWFEQRLKAWRARGVERFITARELALRLTVVPDVRYNLTREVLELSVALDRHDAQHLGPRGEWHARLLASASSGLHGSAGRSWPQDRSSIRAVDSRAGPMAARD